MKIAISSSGKDLEAQIDPRFGRCQYFLIVETDDMSFEVCDNNNAALGGGAGIQSAQFIASKGAQALITGFCGPNAVDTLNAAGIRIYTGQTGTIRDLVTACQNGQLTSTDAANAPQHAGTGGMGTGGGGRGMGGGGRGMGGGGRGMGGGGRGMGGGGRGMGGGGRKGGRA